MKPAAPPEVPRELRDAVNRLLLLLDTRPGCAHPAEKREPQCLPCAYGVVAELLAAAPPSVTGVDGGLREPSSVHPAPWSVREFGYERFALLDASGAEVAEFVSRNDAEFCADARNRRPSTDTAGVAHCRCGDGFTADATCVNCSMLDRMDDTAGARLAEREAVVRLAVAEAEEREADSARVRERNGGFPDGRKTKWNDAIARTYRDFAARIERGDHLTSDHSPPPGKTGEGGR